MIEGFLTITVKLYFKYHKRPATQTDNNVQLLMETEKDT